MKVGDYVRTKDGDIGKIKENDEEIIKYCVGTLYGIGLDRNCLDREVLKSSPNIIDLIELGDLVRLFMEDNLDEENTNTFEVIAITSDKKEIGVFTKDCEIDFYPIENLRGIVTKEQFSQMEYRIGG